jgi:hypothetical protein
VNHDLLALEGGEEVGDDSNLPPGRVRLTLLLSECERLGRRPLLAAGAEGAGVELLLARWLEGGTLGSRPLGPLGGEDDEPARERVAAKLAVQRSFPRMSGRKSSIGTGRMIVEERSELISSMVWRKRS